MLEATMNPVYKRLDAIERPLGNPYQPPPNAAKWVDYDEMEGTPQNEELEYVDLALQVAAANHTADRLGDAEHAYFISEEGQCE
jgi:hypothetical protein